MTAGRRRLRWRTTRDKSVMSDHSLAQRPRARALAPSVLFNLILRTAAGLAASQYRRRRLMLPGTAYVYLRQNTEALLSFSSFLLNKQKGMDGWMEH